MCTLWDEAATMVQQILDKQKGLHRFEGILRMSGMRVQPLQKSEWNGACLANIRVLHSYSASTMRGGTELSVWREPESPYMRTAVNRSLDRRGV